MIDFEQDERLLDQFRTWLREARLEASTIDLDENGPPPPAASFGLGRLMEEFTALRHELKLQTRSSRSLEERLEASLALLAEAAQTFQSAASQTLSAPSAAANKNFALTLAELDEALDRGREQWEKNSARLLGPSQSESLTSLREHYAAQPKWRQWFTAAYHRQICQHLSAADEQARRDRQAVLNALLSGYGMIQQRLARTLRDAGVMRIPTVGRLVDPDQMIVVEVVDLEGPSGQVVDEVRRGYTWTGGLLRPAEVRAIRPQFNDDVEN